MRKQASVALLIATVAVAGGTGTARAEQAKKAGPIKACVFLTYDDVISSGIIKMTATGASDMKGTFALGAVGN